METTTASEAAEILDTTPRRVQQLAASGAITIVRRWGRTLELNTASVLRLKARREAKKESKTNGKG